MSNIKDVRCKPGLAQYGRHVVRSHRRRWAHTPAIHAASYVDHEEIVAPVSISMHVCGSVPIVMVLRLAVWAAGAPLLTRNA